MTSCHTSVISRHSTHCISFWKQGDYTAHHFEDRLTLTKTYHTSWCVQTCITQHYSPLAPWGVEKAYSHSLLTAHSLPTEGSHDSSSSASSDHIRSTHGSWCVSCWAQRGLSVTPPNPRSRAYVHQGTERHTTHGRHHCRHQSQPPTITVRHNRQCHVEESFNSRQLVPMHASSDYGHST